MANEESCWECGKKMLKKSVPYVLYGVKIGVFPALVCLKCEEQIFSEETSKSITRVVKERGLWGLEAKTRIGQAGNTLDIRLPKRIIDFINVKKGAEVTITPETQNKIVITV